MDSSMATTGVFELRRFGCGGETPCRLDCGGPSSCTSRVAGTLVEAIRQAREIADYDPLNAVEIRQDGEIVCTVGQGWMSRRPLPTPQKARAQA
jgi:hypothetical protein